MSRTVFITGASSGLGAGLTPLYVKNGDNVVIIARRTERIKELAHQLDPEAGQVLAITCDVTDREAVHEAVKTGQNHFGPIDVLIANAGITSRTSVELFDAATISKIYNTNVMGVVHCIEAVVPAMIQQKQGQIVGISSLAGYRGLPRTAAYSSSKAALINLLEGLRIELIPHNVTVTTICPGFIKTEITANSKFAMPFILELEDAVQRMYRAIERKDIYYAFPWQLATLVRIGRFVPSRIYDRLVRKILKR